MKVKNLKGIQIPYILQNDIIYYPIKYIMEKVLKRSSVQFHKKDEYKKDVIRLSVNFDFCGGGDQEVYLIEERSLRRFLEGSKPGCLKGEKYDRFMILCEYLKCNTQKFKIIGDKRIDRSIKRFNEYERYCILKYMENHKKGEEIIKKKCNLCGRILPETSEFFKASNLKEAIFEGSCKECKSKRGKKQNSFKSDLLSERVYRNFGEKGFKLMKKDIGEFYYKYVYKKDETISLNHILDDINKMNIIKYLYNKGELKACDLNIVKIREITNINIDMNRINNSDINCFVSNGECIVKPYKYINFINTPSMELGVIILRNYIEDNKLDIDIKTFDGFEKLIKKEARVSSRVSGIRGGFLELLCLAYNKPGYMFKYKSTKYYNYKENRVRDIKYLIEEDLKLDISKIPLYVTMYLLSQKARPIYTWIRKKNTKGEHLELFDLIDECYPNIYIREDFNLNPYRTNFDSLEEAQINDILKSEFESVIYNIRNSDYEFKINNKKPDWIILTQEGCYIVEYFGLYEDKSDDKISSRGNMYSKKMMNKIDKYKEISGYKFLYIYPDDLKDDFKNLRSKIEMIKNNN